ncbi:MAG: pilus assembly PilX N-terminal domain-containing protein [Patescibacteria group bacterium]|jgi:hypothetical protein
MSLKNDNQGAVLLYALLIMSLITAIALTVSIIVVNELALTSTASNSTMAYYAAESGIERGLFTVKIMRADNSNNLTQTVTAILAQADNFSSVQSNNASYSNAGTSKKSTQIENENILENKYVQADYYDIDNSLNPLFTVESIRIINEGDNLGSWADVSWTAWNENGLLGYSDRARRIIGPTDLKMVNGYPINLNVFTDITPTGYRLRIKAMSGDLSDLTVTPFKQPNGVDPLSADDLPSQILIKSVGTRGNFKQSLTAQVPWKVPLFGLYDYVLFSEGEIYKTIILGQPIYSSGTVQVESGLTDQCIDCDSCTTGGASWLSCVDTVSCTDATPPTYCSMGNNNGASFTMPLADTILAGSEYYVSLRVSSAAGSSLETLINDPETGETGLVITLPASATFQTCTISEPFSLSAQPGRTIRFENKTINPVKIDWYQISSYKIFEDCR